MQNSNLRKLFIDVTFLFDQYSLRGIGRAGKEIVKRLIVQNQLQNEFEIHLLGFKNIEDNLIQIGFTNFEVNDFKSNVVFHSFGDPVPSGIMNLVRWGGWYKPLIDSIKPEIFYALHLERGLPTAPIFSRSLSFIPKTVVFYPDAIPIAIPNFKYSKKGFIQNIIKKIFYLTLLKGVQDADLILTCSEFSKNDIIKFAKINTDKVKSIYLGIDQTFYRKNFKFETGEQRSILGMYQVNDRNYYFYDTGIESNKNSKQLLEIFAELVSDKSLPQYLVITGADFEQGFGTRINSNSAAGKEFLKTTEELSILNNIITTGKIPELHLKYLLFNSSAYINLSTYEGFHFGPLQAMAAKVPAIASNTSCTPEVTKGGAFLIDLSNSKNAARKIKDFLKDQELQNEYISKGELVVRDYNWDSTAKQTFEAIKNL